MDIEKYAELIKGRYKDSFELLYTLLVDNNKKINITSICGQEEVFYKHFIDSLAGESFIKKGALVAEIGSGGGFPSLPIKIVRDDLKFLLIESTGKKCAYLKEVVKILNLQGIDIYCGRAEEAAHKNFRESFDVAEARAVARLNTLCEYCLPFVKVGGIFLSYKGGDCEEEVKEAQKAIEILGAKLESVEKYSLPNGDKRALIIIKKIAPTPINYPRGRGKERKSPII